MNNKLPKYTKELQVAKKIALSAGKIMLKYFDGDQKIEIKEDDSQVTIADKLINSLVIKELKKSFPKDGIIGEEESVSEYGGGRIWFCDPIDGTAGYVWGIPTSVFSLSLVIDGVPVLGVVYDPYLKKMYTGVRGGGSFCNGKKLKVSNLKLKDGITAISGSTKSIPSLSYLEALQKTGTRFATFSGAIYKFCLVARGRFVAYMEAGLNAHDVAAAEVIVEEAGGKVTNYKGEKLNYLKPFKGSVVSNGVVHEEILKIINGN